jgi:spermidine synthase
MFAIGLGHEMPSLLAVVVAFFAGLAIGAWALDAPVSRSRRPGYWYGALELIIGFWGFVLAEFFPRISDLAVSAVGLDVSPFRHWTMAFMIPFIFLLPATVAMGATLPAMDRFVSPCAADRRSIGALYATNTLGAVVGTVASTFWIIPALGFTRTIAIFAGLNVLCGLLALLIEATVQRSVAIHAQIRRTTIKVVPARRLSLTVFIIGLLGIGYEVLGVRLLAQVLENTIYSYAVALSVYLLGTAIGAALYQRLGRRFEFRSLLNYLLIGISVTCLVGMWLLFKSQNVYHSIRTALGDGRLGVLAAELAVATAVFGLPTILLGAAFSHLVQSARQSEGGVGKAVAFNTLGCALAPLLFGVAMLSTMGAKWTLVLIALGYLLLLAKISRWQKLAVLVPVGIMFALPGKLQLVQMPDGGKLLEYREGVMDSVAVIEHFDGNRSLQVNNRFNMGGTGAVNAQRRHAHIPLLLHPDPRRALFLGVGTGISLGAFSEHRNLQTDGVELVPEIIEVLHQFEPFNQQPARNPQLKLHVADARRFVRVTETRYDVIVADLFHPARDGAGALYTREHFQAIRQRLAAGGLFCQWLPLFQLDEPMLKVIVRTFLEAFPHTRGYLLRLNVDTPVLGLVGTLKPIRYPANWFGQRVRDPKLLAQLKSLTLMDEFQLFGCLVAAPDALREFSRAAQINTDDHPMVIFQAPRFDYIRTQTTYGRLLTLLDLHAAAAHELIQSDGDPGGRPIHSSTVRLHRRSRRLRAGVGRGGGGKHAASCRCIRGERADQPRLFDRLCALSDDRDAGVEIQSSGRSCIASAPARGASRHGRLRRNCSNVCQSSDPLQQAWLNVIVFGIPGSSAPCRS